MLRSFQPRMTFPFAVVALLVVSCAHMEPAAVTPPPPVKPIPEGPMPFEEGIRALASNLADQVEQSGVGAVAGRTAADRSTPQKPATKIAVDPFVDAGSGYPLAANPRIAEIMRSAIGERFEVSGPSAPDARPKGRCANYCRFEISGELDTQTLPVSELVLNGIATLENKNDNTYKVTSTVVEKTTGEVIASSVVRISGFDATPMELYQDSPVFVKGDGYKGKVTATNKSPGETVDKQYLDGLPVRAIQNEGDRMYKRKEFRKSLQCYEHAASLQQGQQLDILNGQFTNYLAMGELSQAEEVYKKLLAGSVIETGQILNKILFAPGLKKPLESNASLYNIYVRQIAAFVVGRARCKLKIVGHASPTGAEEYNNTLSHERAQWIQKQMAVYAPEIENRSTAIGRGFRENIVGTGRDDATDQIDRRVEFIFMDCGE